MTEKVKDSWPDGLPKESLPFHAPKDSPPKFRRNSFLARQTAVPRARNQTRRRSFSYAYVPARPVPIPPRSTHACLPVIHSCHGLDSKHALSTHTYREHRKRRAGSFCLLRAHQELFCEVSLICKMFVWNSERSEQFLNRILLKLTWLLIQM